MIALVANGPATSAAVAILIRHVSIVSNISQGEVVKGNHVLVALSTILEHESIKTYSRSHR